MKKNWKRALAFLTAISCMVGSQISVYASQTEAEGQTKVPRVTFENEEKNNADLYIKKTVENADGNYPAPEDDTFTFTLKLGGELANRKTYRVFGADGKEIIRNTNGTFFDDILATVMPNPFQTDRNGTFTLKAGQTAVFESVGSGTAYEVTEGKTEGYVQTVPAEGSSATGTVTAKGATAEFTNLYQPSGTGGKTRLEVRKTISFPGGYEAPETPDFTFQVKLGGTVYADEPYTVKDNTTGKEVSIPEEKNGIQQTDANGVFTLKGGQTAVFENIELPKGVDAIDYRVEELSLADGWRATGSLVQEGATTSPLTLAVFNNASASFAVTKRMEDGSKPDVSFTFLLTKADRSVWTDAPYYLYNTTGELVKETVQMTRSDGTFELKPGQTAIFIGIEPGTIYNVSEQGDPEYIQTVPSQAEGYTDKAVTNAVEELIFVNRPAEKVTSLNVTKNVENSTDEAPFAKDEFHFILYKKTGNDWTPVTDAVYRIQAGDSEYTYYTGTGAEVIERPEAYRDTAAGGFTLKADETVRFTELAAGKYKVTESSTNVEYEVKDNANELEGEVVFNGDPVNLIFTNIYTPRYLDLYITKKDRSDKVLEGAEFALYRDAALTNPVIDESQGGTGKALTFTTDAGGKITIPDLKAGTYYLAEIKAPAGYQLLTNPIKLELVREGKHLSLTVDGETYTGTDASQENYVVLKEGLTTGNDEAHITIHNNRNFGLPLTGGRGIGWNLLAGIACVALLLWMGRRKTQLKA